MIGSFEIENLTLLIMTITVGLLIIDGAVALIYCGIAAR